MASALRGKVVKTKKHLSRESSLAAAIGHVVLQSMSANGISRALSSKGMGGLLRKVHTPDGRKKAMATLAKAKSPLYSVKRDANTGEFQIEKGRIMAGEFVPIRRK